MRQHVLPRSRQGLSSLGPRQWLFRWWCRKAFVVRVQPWVKLVRLDNGDRRIKLLLLWDMVIRGGTGMLIASAAPKDRSRYDCNLTAQKMRTEQKNTKPSVVFFFWVRNLAIKHWRAPGEVPAQSSWHPEGSTSDLTAATRLLRSCWRPGHSQILPHGCSQLPWAFCTLFLWKDLPRNAANNELDVS